MIYMCIFIPRAMQPLIFTYEPKTSKNQKPLKCVLSHGDFFLNKKYEYYIRFMHTRAVQWAIRGLDCLSFGALYEKIIAKVNYNAIKKGQVDIQSFGKRRIEAYRKYCKARGLGEVDMIIEGHFHIGECYMSDILYISLPSFYVNRSIFKIESAIKHIEESGIEVR